MDTLNTKQVADLTGINDRTVRKYAVKLDIEFTGSGNRKDYIWKPHDVERLKEAFRTAKTGRPPKKTL